MHNLIHESVINGDDIAPIISNLEMAAEGVDREHLIVALLSMTLIVTYPEITPEQLQSAVRDVSRYICLVLDNPQAPEDTDPKMLMN